MIMGAMTCLTEGPNQNSKNQGVNMQKDKQVSVDTSSSSRLKKTIDVPIRKHPSAMIQRKIGGLAFSNVNIGWLHRRRLLEKSITAELRIHISIIMRRVFSKRVLKSCHYLASIPQGRILILYVESRRILCWFISWSFDQLK